MRRFLANSKRRGCSSRLRTSQRTCKVKQTVDPNGVFTANTFVVGYSPETAPKHLAAAPRDIAVVRKPEEVFDDAAFAKEHADRAGLRAQTKGIATAALFRPRR